jgi:hypothetical protein
LQQTARTNDDLPWFSIFASVSRLLSTPPASSDPCGQALHRQRQTGRLRPCTTASGHWQIGLMGKTALSARRERGISTSVHFLGQCGKMALVQRSAADILAQQGGFTMPRIDRIKRHIEQFFEYRREWDVRKAGGGYGFYHQDDGRPLARLKPHQDGGFEIQYWCRRKRWKTWPSKTRLVLPLDEALEFVLKNPTGR